MTGRGAAPPPVVGEVDDWAGPVALELAGAVTTSVAVDDLGAASLVEAFLLPEHSFVPGSAAKHWE